MGKEEDGECGRAKKVTYWQQNFVIIVFLALDALQALAILHPSQPAASRLLLSLLFFLELAVCHDGLNGQSTPAKF